MSQHKTRPIMTKFEKTSIIGTRMEQLQRGSEPYIPIDPAKPFNPRDIAVEELKQKKLPFLINRTLPDGSKETWKVEDLEVC